jgi:hypothetical protein
MTCPPFLAVGRKSLDPSLQIPSLHPFPPRWRLGLRRGGMKMDDGDPTTGWLATGSSLKRGRLSGRSTERETVLYMDVVSTYSSGCLSLGDCNTVLILKFSKDSLTKSRPCSDSCEMRAANSRLRNAAVMIMDRASGPHKSMSLRLRMRGKYGRNVLGKKSPLLTPGHHGSPPTTISASWYSGAPIKYLIIPTGVLRMISATLVSHLMISATSWKL